ncbi:MAG: UDP-N-acetylglucosamine--N-acetylmuramyl-(pentapeptide) pyrophosphoryl-undecaprenol N-acetylglucosamine transferase [Candidatus Doudnabacteria bacterium]
MKILLAGGGTGGPVTPVIAVAMEIRKLRPKTEFLFVGTRTGPDRAMVEPANIRFVSIPAARWRRFFTIQNLFAPIVLITGFLSSLRIVRKFRPDVVFSAGSFVAVPVAWAARLYGAKIVIHQQDARIGLANKLISPIADQITTAFEKTSKEFYSGSGLFEKRLKPAAQWVGNPVRPDLFNSAVDAKKFFNLHEELPILLVLGGATGAKQINQLIGEILPVLVKTHQVVHITGKNKNSVTFSSRNYLPFEFLAFPEYAAILKLAHLVVARAGLSTIAELSALGKPAIIIPMPNTHQEDNARILQEAHSAAVLSRDEATTDNLARVINNLKFNQAQTGILSRNISKLMPKDAAMLLAKVVIKQVHPHTNQGE